MTDPSSAQSGATPDDDLDRLLGDALAEAERLVQQFSEFYPFGSVITVDGEEERVMVAPDDGNDFPAAQDVRDALWAVLREHRDQYRAVAVTANVTAADGSDAVHVELEHRDGATRGRIFTYRRRFLTRRFRYLEPYRADTTRRVWP